MSELVAVYGSLRKGLGNHRVLGDSKLVSTGIVQGFGMYSMGGFPALTTLANKTDVVVEVYEVDNDTMRRLDRLEGYPHFYNRVPVPIHLNEGEDGVESYLTAWIYFIDDKFPEKSFVESGDWVEYYG